MTPTLIGRWQARIFLLATVGVLVSLPFVQGTLQAGDGLGSSWNPFFLFGLLEDQIIPTRDTGFFWVLFYAGLFGLAWDVLYNYLQRFFWDHDWPGVLQGAASIVEGVLILILIKTIGLPMYNPDAVSMIAPNLPVSRIDPDLPIPLFWYHYGLVSFAAFLFSWGGMRILFPRSRFRGGAWFGPWRRVRM